MLQDDSRPCRPRQCAAPLAQRFGTSTPQPSRVSPQKRGAQRASACVMRSPLSYLRVPCRWAWPQKCQRRTGQKSQPGACPSSPDCAGFQNVFLSAPMPMPPTSRETDFLQAGRPLADHLVTPTFGFTEHQTAIRCHPKLVTSRSNPHGLFTACELKSSTADFRLQNVTGPQSCGHAPPPHTAALPAALQRCGPAHLWHGKALQSVSALEPTTGSARFANSSTSLTLSKARGNEVFAEDYPRLRH